VSNGKVIVLSQPLSDEWRLEKENFTAEGHYQPARVVTSGIDHTRRIICNIIIADILPGPGADEIGRQIAAIPKMLQALQLTWDRAVITGQSHFSAFQAVKEALKAARGED
jgi:hypothetical protein